MSYHHINNAATAKLVGVDRGTLYRWKATRPELYQAVMEYAERNGCVK